MPEQGLKTVEALAYAALNPVTFNSAVQERIFVDLPSAVINRTGRTFGVDDLVTLDAFRKLLDIGVELHVAGRLADNLRSMLRADLRLRQLHLVRVRTPDGTTWPEFVHQTAKDVKVLWTIHVAKARKSARAAIIAQPTAEWETDAD